MQLNNTTDLLQSKGIKTKKVTQTDEYVFIEAETEHPGKEHLWRKKQMVLEIGRTCYTVNLILKESGKETYKDKVFRLLDQDIDNEQEKNFEEI